ncbi:MAG: hypothetical protein JXC85_03315 [Candidatus Aenigmarchaeota archaeon]|nr:hypothetical protein [Candidatus Aenigmarchaeota archaeon]
MDRIERLLLQSVAVLCTYLVLSISTASAIEISIYQQILSGTTVTTTGEKEDISLDPGVLVEKKFDFVHDPSDFKWEKVQVKIEVVGKDPLYPIKKIYLFKCKDTNPLDCVDYEPVEADSYLSGDKGTFNWKDVSRSNSANFLTMIKFSHDGVDFWVGYWDEATRSGIQTFEHHDYDMSHIDVYTEPGIQASWIKDFIGTYYMIPANWMDKAALGNVDGKATSEIYEIVADKSDIDIPYFEKYKPATRIIDQVTKDFMLAFGRGSISNPVTFYSNPLPDCGDGACDLGENAANCCLDCGCPSSGQLCSANSDHPNGLCHVCGDSVVDPVENGTNCCIDAGCPLGLDCDPNMNIPYGKCVSPECGNGNCEPSEDSRTCPVDCHDAPGKGCEDVYGYGYYYSSQLQECILAVCGQKGCEGSEDSSNCCLDCGGCPSGQYCNTDQVPNGVCMPPTCGNGRCEPGEGYSSCCLDCDNCPADPYTGELQTCTQNICHLCGNGVIESPVETPVTCCQDTGCTDGYCSVSGSCKTESEIGMNVKMLPDSVDCTQAGEVDIRFTFKKGPAFFNSFESISYTYQNSRYRLTQCIQQGDIYMCKLYLTGPETFPGCFQEGIQDVDFSVLFTYYDDRAAKKSNDLKYKDLTVPFSFEVIKARQRACNKNGACEPGVGETPETCCWDCQCEGGAICTASGCKDELEISLAVNPEDLPARNNIDCSPRNGMQPNGDFKFRAHVQNVPESAYEMFNVLNWKLEYNGKTYTAQNIPGFTCSPVVTEYGHHTGDVECTVPVSMFPACPNPPPADMTLTLNILGGGLGNHYAPYEGKAVSASFSLDYVQGLPLCGNGEPNPELGETTDSCCRDMGCPGNKVCTLYSGCVDQSQVDIAVSVNPANIDCSRVPVAQRGRKQVILLAELTKKPYSPATGGVEFGDAYLDDSRIEEMGGICEPVVNSTQYSVYAWRCSIPVDDFNPFCWAAGSYTPNFENTITWQDSSGNRITKRIIKPVSFSVQIPRDRQCVPDGFQDPELGEIIDQCCPDAGCSGDRVCTLDVECVDPTQIALVVDDVGPDSLDCSAKANADNKVTVTVHLDNMPYNTHFIEWFMEYAGNTFTEQYFTCSPLTYGELQSSSYKCEIPVYYFPACAEEGSHTLNLKARITHGDYRGKVLQNEVSDNFVVVVGKKGLPNCGNSVCDTSLGETSNNCCQDCGCTNKEDVCTIEGACYPESQITMTVEPVGLNTNCQLAPWDMDTFKILSYQCVFQDQIKLRAHLSHKPWMSSVISTSYVWDKGEAFSDAISPGEDIADGWNLYAMLNPDGSYTISAFAGDKHVSRHDIKSISLTVQVPSHTGDYERVIKVDSINDVKVTVNEMKNENLLELEKSLKDAKEAMEKARRMVCTIVSILAICTICSLMAGGVVDKAADDVGKDAASSATEQEAYDAGLNKFSNVDANSPAYKNRLAQYGGAGHERDMFIGEGRKSIGADARQKWLNQQQGPMNQQGRGNIPMGVFSSMMSATAGLGKWGSSAAGVLAGLAFIWVASDMLECEDKMVDAIGVAIGICGALALFGGSAGAKFLAGMTKVCNLLSLALQLLMMITQIQDMSMKYQACQMEAESQLARQPGDTETGYERSRRISEYYRKLAACHQGLGSDLATQMQSWADFSYNLDMSSGGRSSYIQADPAFGSTVGPGSTINMNYAFPPTGSQGTYGQVSLSFNYYYQVSGGSLPTQVAMRAIRLSQSRGSINCDVTSDGLTCTSGGQVATLNTGRCENFVTGATWWDRTTSPSEVCKGAILKGTFSVSWQPCTIDCNGDFRYDSSYTGTSGPPTVTTTPTTVQARGCCQYTSGTCYTAPNTNAGFESECEKTLPPPEVGPPEPPLGKYMPETICYENKCLTPQEYCTSKNGKWYSSGLCFEGEPRPDGVIGDWKCCKQGKYFDDAVAYCRSLSGEWCTGDQICIQPNQNGVIPPQFKKAEYGMTLSVMLAGISGSNALGASDVWRCCNPSFCATAQTYCTESTDKGGLGGKWCAPDQTCLLPHPTPSQLAGTAQWKCCKTECQPGT